MLSAHAAALRIGPARLSLRSLRSCTRFQSSLPVQTQGGWPSFVQACYVPPQLRLGPA